ncbi:ABC transporter permease [Cohnella nanjingensis]|uniref:ABC transporter permease n=1 Tax=Cohnella nanjingensis TaxID=1387779 RepID=A0A7X0S0Y4_9BACL|nr:ABC transporter permease [Cohnella nanjingensis]MBB6675649.1 ABC transporter permease [Cohnella nanjingensis]
MANPSRPPRNAKLREWRSGRAAAFRGEVLPYVRYVFQSGFALVLSAIGITLLAWYAGLLSKMPTAWPADIVGTAALALASVYAPLRTYMEPADTVYLLPVERALLSDVLRPSVRRAGIAGGLRALAVFAVFAPLYVRAPVTADAAPAGTAGWIALALSFALLGGWNAYAAWGERRCASAAWRFWLRGARWAVTALAAWALLTKALALSLPFAVLAAALVSAASLLAARHALPWDRVIAEEQGARRRWKGFLGWFVDVPNESPSPARRAWIAWIGDRLPRTRRYAWHYLYVKTMLRGEAFGAFWRWNAVLAVILAFAKQPSVDMIAYAIAVAVGGLQLTELGRIRFAEHASVVPLPPEGRRLAAAAAVRMAGVAAAVLLWLIAAVPSRPFDASLWLLALAAGLLWTGWLLPRRVAKPDEDDEDDA